jgi:hypothetical protein
VSSAVASASRLAWIDRLPWAPLVVAAALLGAAPFVPEPHLVEKIRMLFAGMLSRPLDIFDLCFHATPLVLIALKLGRRRADRSH